MEYNPTDYDFEYDDDILVCDDPTCLNGLPVWRHTNFDHIESGNVVDVTGFYWDYAIPYYEHLKGACMTKDDFCL